MIKIYIMTDMEGVSGINNEAQTQQGSPLYDAGCALLHADVNAAIAGAFDGGAEEVVVCDGHATGFNFRIEELDQRAEYERPGGPLNVMPGLDKTFAGLFCVGYHAMAGTLDGFLDHTQSSTQILNYFINDVRCGELAQMAVLAGSYGVPVLLVTGDEAACQEALGCLNTVTTVAVKRGIGRQHARCLHPDKTRAMIRDAAARAVALRDCAEPYGIDTPALIRIEYYRSDMADAAVQTKGSRRVDARTVECSIDNSRDLLAML